jgi:lysophospholipase L1-like esterase
MKRERARSRRRTVLVVLSLVAVLAVAGLVFKNYWDARVRSAYQHSTDVYTPKPVATPKVALFVGDGMLQGNGATAAALRFSSLVSSKYHWFEINVATGGAGYYAGNPNLVSQLSSLKKYKPSIIFVSAGRSDGWSPDVQLNVAKFYGDIRKVFKKTTIVVVSPLNNQPMPTPPPTPSPMQLLQNAVRGAAYSANAVYVPIENLLAGNPKLLSTDSYNPSDAGHKAIADAIIAALKNNGFKPPKS